VTDVYEDLGFKCILETTARRVSERPFFLSRRVILSEHRIPVVNRVVKIGDNDVPYIIYSEQRNVWKGQTFVWEYTGMDETQVAEVVELQGGVAASGQQIDTVPITLYSMPIHMFRNTSTESAVHDDADFSKAVALVPGNVPLNTDMELQITTNGHTNSYTIQEVVPELFSQRLSLIER
jgi:hypothetical protein